ncbi:hypothetical protein KSD_17380 [Ktedonobacter sp. SOSP1-85]|uniref:DUF6166 domain-containing protein n=1 Tax=Ktedonobacter sp. SOSP1-85 TaxID=2778367 RepID=UPI0019150D85|nr:DUF6166 domain-containing protein [Ktedonobacter sp. SOSP1-85]GHO73967.1 hypothetical protein KSD_17380 [Ktedonobacter sp. SOSP1-85]
MPEELIGQKIRLARKKRNWSQETLAEKLGVAARTVLRWEKKDKFPNYESQRGLIDILGLKEEDFQRERQPLSAEKKQEKPVSPATVSELEQMLPPKEDFKLYCGRRVYRREGKYSSKGTYVTVNGRPLKYFGSEKRNPEKEIVFEWGYSGGGPSRLAEAILADYLGETYPESEFGSSSKLNALLFGGLFKEEFIVKLPRSLYREMDDYWQIASTQIRKWFYSLEEEGVTRAALLKDIYG